MGDGSRRTRVFISYSRKDIDFVEKLSAALAERGYFADFDLGGDGDKVEGGIAPGDQWATRLKEMVIAADAFVLVVSPNSASSPVCDWEIDEAQKLAKRIIPVIWRRVDLAGASQRLAALHVALTFEPRAGEEHQTPEAFGSSLESLVKAIDTDIGWLREHSRLTQLASRWSDNQRPEAQLLRTGEITAAELWAARRPPNVSEPPELLFEFLAESRKKEEHDRAELERSEHNARLQAADAWFERALVHLKSAERHHACECLLRSVEVASPNAVPSWFSPTLSQQGWAGNARTLCGCLSPGLPRLIARYALEKEDTEQAQFCCWIDSGNSVVLAHGNELRAYDIHEGSWTPGGRLAREGRVMALAGARAAARACALYDTREIILLDLAGGDTLRFDLSDDVARAAIAIGDAGDELLLVERRGEKVAVRIVRWGSLERTLEIEIPLDDPERKDLWAGFSADSREIGVIAGACLHVFGRDGTLARKLALRNLTSHYSIAPDLYAAASSAYDLVLLRQSPRETGEPKGDSGSPEGFEAAVSETVLEGAESLIHQIAFMRDGKTLLTLTEGRVQEWRPATDTQRGMSGGGIKYTEQFGQSNRVRPFNQLEGLPDALLIVPHPAKSNEFLLVCSDEICQVQLAAKDQLVAEFGHFGPAARVVVDGDSGRVAVATAQGAQLFDGLKGPYDSEQPVGPQMTVWDVALRGDRLAAAYADNYVRIFELPGLHEVEEFRLPAIPRSLAFIGATGGLLIGLDNGVLWERLPAGEMVRIGALGIGPITRIRVSPDSRLGVAAGNRGNFDDEKSDEYNLHGGVAVWNVEERRILWSNDRILQPLDLDLSGDSTIILIGNMRGARMYDTISGASLASFQPPQSDPSKPKWVTSVCMGPDDRLAYLGLWDGSVALADMFSQRAYSVTKPHEKYVSSISADRSSGLIYSASITEMAEDNLVVAKGWDPEFFGDPCDADWFDTRKSRFESAYGPLRLDRVKASYFEHDEAVPPSDEIVRGREILGRDETRAADLFAQAIVSGREEELSADERRLAGESFLDSGNEVEARRHLEYAAQAGIPQAAVTLGLRLIGRQQSVEDWQPGLPYFQTAAQAGDAHAMFLLGYYFDEIVRRNVGAVDWRALAQPSQPGPAAASEAELQSLHWYRKAAELGHARAAAKMEGRD